MGELKVLVVEEFMHNDADPNFCLLCVTAFWTVSRNVAMSITPILTTYGIKHQS